VPHLTTTEETHDETFNATKIESLNTAKQNTIKAAFTTASENTFKTAHNAAISKTIETTFYYTHTPTESATT